MHIKNTDRQTLANAYRQVVECECQHNEIQQGLNNSSEERIEMILNNLVVLNNKSAELVKLIQAAVDSGEGIDEWASEKIAIASNYITTINDFYNKFKAQQNISPVGGLKLEPLTTAINMPLNTNMPPMSISI